MLAYLENLPISQQVLVALSVTLSVYLTDHIKHPAV